MHISILLDIKKTSSRATQMLRLQKSKGSTTDSNDIVVYNFICLTAPRTEPKTPEKPPENPPETP